MGNKASIDSSGGQDSKKVTREERKQRTKSIIDHVRTKAVSPNTDDEDAKLMSQTHC